MINFTENTKNQYKAYERQFNVYGNLYLAEKRLSNNLLNQNNYLYLSNLVYNNGEFTQTEAGDTSQPNIQMQSYQNGTYIQNLDYKQIQLGIIKFSFTKTNLFNQINYKANDSRLDTGVRFDISNLENGKTYYIGATFTNITQGTISWKDMYISEEDIDYEEYGTIINDYTLFPLTEENECKILGFNINEKTDIYYTSLPYNTMTIDVDNEKGYFTDYDVDSIVNKLNTDCYVDLFIKINDDDYYKIMTMKFDKISSSDYEKATLSFKSSISILKTLPLRDKNKYFQTNIWTRKMLKEFLYDNYKIGFKYNGENLIWTFNSTSLINPSVERMVLAGATRQGNLERAVLTTNDYQDNISFKNWLSYAQDTITRDYQLEKPIIKREDTYQGVDHTYIYYGNYESTTETYNRTINDKLRSEQEIIIYTDENYKLSDITINDITTSSGIVVNIVQNTTNNPNILMLSLKGNIDQNYTITINKENIYKKTNNVLKNEKYGLTSDTSKILKINETSPLNGDYYNLILNDKTVRSYIEAKIIGLPYLEIGDTVEIETELAKILITISELNITFDGGLTETIKGYELGWDALFPSDTLYPSDDLYPNRPLD